MARRRRNGTRRRRISRGIRSFGRARGKFGSFLKKGLVGDATQALGAGLVVSAITDRIAPQFSTFAAPVAEYAAGGVRGMVVSQLIRPLIGLPSILPSITGGFGGLFGGSTASTPSEAI